MKRTSILLLVLCTGFAMTWPQVQLSPHSNKISSDAPGLAQVSEAKDSSNSKIVDLPQLLVECTGWHALCTASTDCQMNNINANCDCWRVKEIYIVETTAIRDTPVQRLTWAQCTIGHPCAVDQAPICKAIKSGQYTVNNVKYDWVSTYSYRGWCSLVKMNLKACYPETPGYTGDKNWAVCDVAPCTEIQNPSNPDRPLSCQCQVVKDKPFVGTNGSCRGDNGGIISSMPAWVWDFQNNTYRIFMPGYAYVKGACSPLTSDPYERVSQR